MQHTQEIVFLITAFCFLANVDSEDDFNSFKDRIFFPNEPLPYIREERFYNRYPPQTYEHQLPSNTDRKTVTNRQEIHHRKVTSNTETRGELSLEIAKKIDSMDIQDFLANYVDGYNENKVPDVSLRFGEEGRERNTATVPAKAKCSVENVTVDVAVSNDPKIFYVPQCTKIERCSGCCSHKKLACQPIETEMINVEVYKLQWQVINQKFKYASKELIPMERHVRCSCTCKIKPKDCLPYQEYVEENCQCACKNRDEELKCAENRKKYWDMKNCACKCSDPMPCSDESYTFDNNQCKCVPSLKRRNVKYNRRELSTENILIIPLDEDY